MKKIVKLSIVLICLLLAATTYSFLRFFYHTEYASINKMVTEFKKKEPLNGVVLVAKDNTIIYLRAFGFSNMHTKSYNTRSSEFLLASISKLYTAAAVLLLAQQGKIDIDKPVSDYIKPNHPVWQNAMPAAMNTITVHQLLTHSSGLAKYTRLPGFEEWYSTIHKNALKN